MLSLLSPKPVVFYPDFVSDPLSEIHQNSIIVFRVLIPYSDDADLHQRCSMMAWRLSNPSLRYTYVFADENSKL